MYIVAVAPIKRGTPIEELTYFTKNPLTPGTLVSVPLRKSTVPALVLRSTLATEMKSGIKQAEFSLKKLERVRALNFFREEFVLSAEKTATQFATTRGAVVQAVFPNSLLGMKMEERSDPPPRRTLNFGNKFIFQAEESERFATYKSHIREIFARNKSCMFILPSVQDIEHTYANLSKGIEQYTFIFHSGLSKKELEKRWNEVLHIQHPVLIISTPLFLSLPRNDIETVILDRESSPLYMLHARPFIDMRYFTEIFSQEIGADLILGDLFLRVETLARHNNNELEALMRPKSRISAQSTQSLVDMRTSGEMPSTGKIAIYSAELVDILEATRKKGAQSFIFGVRRGYAPMTVCGDCGTVLPCEFCSAPIVLHKKAKQAEQNNTDETSDNQNKIIQEHVFLCHRCGKERQAEVVCAHCGGWRLIPLGIGIAQAEESIRSRFPDAKIFRLDSDTVKKHSEARKIIEKFYQTPGGILIGTEMALPYLTQPISTVAVLSVNSLLTLPDFRMSEKVFRLLLTLREKAREHFLVQTRDPEMEVFSLALQGNITEFVQTELTARKQFGFPPFSIFIKLTFTGEREEGERIMGDIENIFSVYTPVTFPGFISRIKGKYIMNALLKLEPSDWPNNDLLALIRALPPEVTVRINPENVI